MNNTEPPLLTDPAQFSRLRDLVSALRLVVFDFDGVFTDNAVYVFQDGTEAVRAWRGDGLGLRELEAVGLTPIILSTETNPVVHARAEKLRVRCIQGIESKLPALKTLAQELNVTMEQIAYVGNDINDAECLRAVRLPIVVNDAHPAVLPLARFRTETRGGYGAVRQICDVIANIFKMKRAEHERS